MRGISKNHLVNTIILESINAWKLKETTSQHCSEVFRFGKRTRNIILFTYSIKYDRKGVQCEKKT